MDASVLLASARSSANHTQRGLAQASGKAQSAIAFIETSRHDVTTSTLGELLAPCGYQLATLPTLVPSAQVAANELSKHLDRPRVALRLVIGFVGQLQSVDQATRVGLCLAEPRSTDSAWDAVLAGAVEYTLRGLPKPGWLGRSRWSSQEPFYIGSTEAARQFARQHTPVEFANRNVFIAETEFASV